MSKPSLLEGLLGADRLHPPRVERDRVSVVAGATWIATRDGRTVVHGGAGRYFDPAASANQVNLVLERQALSPLGSRATSPPVDFAQPTATTGAHVVALVPQLWADLRRRLNPANRDFTFRNIDANKSGRSLADPSFTIPYGVHVNIGLQRELTSTLSAHVNVVWRRFERTFLTDIDDNRWESDAGAVLPRCVSDRSNELRTAR